MRINFWSKLISCTILLVTLQQTTVIKKVFVYYFLTQRDTQNEQNFVPSIEVKKEYFVIYGS